MASNKGIRCDPTVGFDHVTTGYQDWLVRWTSARQAPHGSHDEVAPAGSAGTGVVIMKVGPVTGLIGVVLGKFGLEVCYVEPSPWETLMDFIRRQGVQPVDIEHVPRLSGGGVVYVEPRDQGAAIATREGQRKICQLLSRGFSSPARIAGGMEAALALKLVSGSYEIGITKLWSRSQGYRRLILFANTRWQKALLDEGDQGFVTAFPARIDSVLTWFVKSAGRIFHASKVRENSVEGNGSTTNIDLEPARVLFIPHQGSIYGRLYRWDHLFSADPESPLHPSKIVALSYSGPVCDSTFLSTAVFNRPSDIQVVRQFSNFFWRNIVHVRSFDALAALAWLSLFSARVLVVSRDIARRFPRATVAILAYEMLVPPHISLALEASGIRTVATQERPSAGLQIYVPKIVDTFLTASEEFSRVLAESVVASIEHSIPNGMWRTDLLIEARVASALAPDHDPGEPIRSIVVVLPFHTEVSKEKSMCSPLQSWSACLGFLENIRDLAVLHPDRTFIVRGKNDDWCQLPFFRTMLMETHDLENFVVDHNYSELNRSYFLCAKADLVIARHTSLADECLAMDVPTIFHDFTHNMSPALGPLFDYLPEELWARDQHELRARVAMSLEAGGDFFRQWWAPRRKALYGNWNDGEVRRRSREIIEDLVGSSPAVTGFADS